MVKEKRTGQKPRRPSPPPQRLTVPGGWHRFPRMQTLATRILVAGLVALMAPGAAHGARVERLYTAEVDRTDLALVEPAAARGDKPAERRNERALRRALMGAALGRVLVRLAGTSQVAQDPLVRERLIDRAPSLVNRFQYLSRRGPDGPRIRVHFTPESVREGLWQTGWPVWGPYRPGVVVWVAQRGNGGLELVSPDSRPRVFEALRGAAEREGLPLLVPLMDGTDRRRLAARDLLFEDWAAIRKASARYDPDVVLLLRLNPQGSDGPRAEWVLREGETSTAFATGGADVGEAVGAGLRGVLVRLACHYAVYPGASVAMQAVVGGIPGLDAYARVERGLGQLAAIEGVTPLRVAGDEARFRFAFQGRATEAAHILGLLDLLEPAGRIVAESGDGGGAPDEPRLQFSYRP
jgi:hypothetical protein